MPFCRIVLKTFRERRRSRCEEGSPRLETRGNAVRRRALSRLGLGSQSNVVFSRPPLRHRPRRAKRVYLASPQNPIPPETPEGTPPCPTSKSVQSACYFKLNEKWSKICFVLPLHLNPPPRPPVKRCRFWPLSDTL